MKKIDKNLTVIMLSFSITVLSQVGVNTQNPRATIDITAQNATGTSTTAEGILIPRVDRQRAQSMQNVVTSTLIYVNSIASGTQTDTAINIDSTGYYYFDGTIWVKINKVNNIYNSDGILTGNRTVTQGTNTISFTGNVTNSFSVDGNTFSVDANNNRVGIGNTAPTSVLAVTTQNAGGTIDAFSAGINNCGTPCGQSTARSITIFNANPTNSKFGGVEFIPSISATGLTGASIIGIDRDVTNSYAGLQFFTRNSSDFGPRVTLKSSGNLGVGTESPTNKLHISGNNPIRLEGLQASSGSVGSLSVNSTGVVQLRNSSSVSAVRATGNITITTNNSYTTIGAASETFDNLNELNGTTFTAAATGLYTVQIVINYNQRANTEDGGDGYLGYCRILQNSTPVSINSAKVTLPENSGSPSYVTCENSQLLKLNSGDTITFQASSYGSTTNATTPITGSYSINIHRID